MLDDVVLLKKNIKKRLFKHIFREVTVISTTLFIKFVQSCKKDLIVPSSSSEPR